MANFAATTAEEMMQKYPFGSQENTYIRMVVGYWEMVCSFVTAGVLNQELLFQSNGELLQVWERLRPVLPAFRQVTKNPQAWRNLETVGNAYVQYIKSLGPEAYQGFQGMMQRIAASSGQ